MITVAVDAMGGDNAPSEIVKGAVNAVSYTHLDVYKRQAMCGEAALEQYLETGRVSDEKIREMIFSRKMFPCCFGSALRLEGVEEFLKALDFWTRPVSYPEEFGARVFKVARDVQGNRLTSVSYTHLDVYKRQA